MGGTALSMTFLIFDKLVERARIRYDSGMTKAEIIARYGQEYYDACQARQKANLKAKYASMPAEERNAVYRARKDYVAQWRKDHPERSAALYRKAALAAYYKMSPEQRLEVARKARAARKAKLAADPAFAKAQAEKQSARAARWDAAHPGVRNERTKAYEKANPHVKRAAKHARRALGNIDPKFVQFLRSQPCADCGAEGKSTIGHLIPVKRGGTNHPCNLIAQCRSCNSKQNAKVHPRFAMAHYPEAARYAVAA